MKLNSNLTDDTLLSQPVLESSLLPEFRHAVNRLRVGEATQIVRNETIIHIERRGDICVYQEDPRVSGETVLTSATANAGGEFELERTTSAA